MDLARSPKTWVIASRQLKVAEANDTEVGKTQKLELLN